MLWHELSCVTISIISWVWHCVRWGTVQWNRDVIKRTIGENVSSFNEEVHGSACVLLVNVLFFYVAILPWHPSLCLNKKTNGNIYVATKEELGRPQNFICYLSAIHLLCYCDFSYRFSCNEKNSGMVLSWHSRQPIRKKRTVARGWGIHLFICLMQSKLVNSNLTVILKLAEIIQKLNLRVPAKSEKSTAYIMEEQEPFWNRKLVNCAEMLGVYQLDTPKFHEVGRVLRTPHFCLLIFRMSWFFAP